MKLFRSQVHQDIWIEHHCERCHHGIPDPMLCPILRRALKTGRKPVEWDRNTRKGALMQDTIRCNMQTNSPPKYGGIRQVTDETITLFDVTPTTTMDSDHA